MYAESHSNLTFGSSGSKTFISKTRLALILLLALVLGLVIGLLIGALVIGADDDDDKGIFLPGAPKRLMEDGDEDVWPMIRDAISPQNIEENLRWLSSKPHIAGRKNDYDLVQGIKDRWENDGMQVQVTPYDILLSYPSDETPNTVRLLGVGDKVVYDSTSDISNITYDADVVAPFLAYSPSKLVLGQPVYAGYGRVEDYDTLQSKGVVVKDAIVIIRYGRLFRGDKVRIAASKGAKAAILYSDPNDVTGELMGDSRIFPDTWWLPKSGIQRGSVFIGSGDPLTPGFVANDLAYRYNEDNADPPLPKIPCHAIGYGAAIHILKQMAGPQAPYNKFWQGGLNITYHLGPGFSDSNLKIELNVTSRNVRKKAENVFGIIKGTIEPDRYVMMGNHRDSWIYGAVDPSSGTAVMLEVSRVMAHLVKQGKWKPRRSIMFCSWGAEEYGMIGSTEWVEQYKSTLRERAVGYINVDIAVNGNDTLQASGTPVLHSLTFEAAKKTPNPTPSEVAADRKTVYDSWLRLNPFKTADGEKPQPLITKPGSGSDYAALIQMAGVDIVDLTYTYDKKKYKVPSYAIYHTEYETFQMVKEQFDRDFKCHQAVARVAAELVRGLSDALLLPLNLTTYAQHMDIYRKMLDHDYGDDLKANLNNYDVLETVIANFSQDVADFEQRKASLNPTNPYVIREINDQLMQLERCFLSPQGLPTRPFKKHLLFAENSNDAYAGSSFPGLVDLLFEINKEPARWEEVKKHFSLVVQSIQSAGASLRDVTRFMLETL